MDEDKFIPQSAISIFARLKQGDENRMSLEKVLSEIETDHKGNKILPFKNLPVIHFCRWFIVNNAKNNRSELLPSTLAFTSNFDGNIEKHLYFLSKEIGEGIDAIYKHCEGYPNKPTIESRFAYLKANRVKEKLFWPGIRGNSVGQILKYNELYKEIQDHIDKEKLYTQSASDCRDNILKFVKNDTQLNWALNPYSGTNLGYKIKYWGRLILSLLIGGIIALFLVFSLILPIWILIGRFLEVKENKKGDRSEQREEEYNDLVSLEDHSFQNQLTVYGSIKSPLFHRRLTLEMALWVFRLNGTYKSNKGLLGGIDSIHFARWVMFNNGRNLAFLSNYDGGWENYLTEFVNRSSTAMNLTFGSMIGYPKTKWLIGEGARDSLAFKSTARNNQYPTQVWYSAYPNLSAKDIHNIIRVRKGLAKSKMNEKEVKEWLRRF